MTKRDFFVVTIKLFGLFSLVTSVFSAIPSTISFALLDLDVISTIWIMLAVTAIGGLFVWLVFKADKLVELLKLAKGFDDERINFGNLLPADVVRIGTVIIGGLLFINSVPAFLSHALFAFKGQNVGIEYDASDNFKWAVSAINLIVGYLLFTNYDIVAKKMAGKTEG